MIRYESENGKLPSSVVLGIGVFDGVHLGHRRIISEVADLARKTGAMPVAVTFFPHPREVLCPDSPPRLLLPPDERLRRLREAGAAGIGIIDFSAAIAVTAPEDFLSRILAAGVPQVRGICVGAHWRFGKNGAGDTRFLGTELARRQVAFTAVPELEIDGGVVSSSAIRDAVAGGDLDRAERMMGAPVCLYGEVEPGCRIATAILETPTANLHVDYGVLPPDGVYATWGEVDGRRCPAITNIGVSPTFEQNGGVRRVETHLLGFSGDLYRRQMKIELKKKLRDEVRFSSPADLKRQIAADRAQALQILTAGGAK